MSMLKFPCSNSGKKIDAGIEVDQQTLDRLNVLFVRLPCPYYRYDHLRQIKSREIRPPQFACDEIPSHMTDLLTLIPHGLDLQRN